MRLAKATFEKVGPFKDFSIEFKKNKRKDLAEVHILTGPNGSGKSTILRGLSHVFGYSAKTPSNFSDSFWTSGDKGSFIRVFDDSAEHATITASKVGFMPIATSMRDGKVPFEKYSKMVSDFRVSDKEVEIPFAVFGYSGTRFLSAENQFSVGTYGIRPFENAVDFERILQDNPTSLANWIGNILAKEAFAKLNKDKKQASVSRDTINRFGSMLNEITGREIRFNVNTVVLRVNMLLDGNEVELSVLPDGLKSILSWLGDLIQRMESIPWKEKKSIFDQPIILFLDEIDIHLHPSWQKKILPIIQKTFVNAQIFVSTHSPFVVASVEDAYVYDLNIGKDGHAFLENVIHTERGQTYSRVLKEIFDVETDFADPWTLEKLPKFYELLKHVKSKDTKAYKDAFSVGKELAEASIELRDIVSVELNQLDRRIAAVK